MTNLTDIQRKVFEYVSEELLVGRAGPSYREISAHFGWTSLGSVGGHIAAIVRKGWLLSEPHKARSLQLPKSKRRPHRSTRAIPIRGSIPAGRPDDRRQESSGFTSIGIETLGTKPSPLAFGLEVTGDSMIGKHIAPGDVVIIEPRSNPKNGDVVAALIDGETTLKTLVMRGGKTYLRAENPKYPNLVPADELVIQGVAITLVRKLR